MNKIKELLTFTGLFFGLVVITFFIGTFIVPKADPIKQISDTAKKEEKRMEILRLSAVGDSLTEGIGDTTHTGGYVPLLQTDLSEHYPIDVVQAENFGKSGDRSDQILKRIKKNEDMQNSIRKADVILVTVGGNDLMKVIQSQIFNKLSIKKFVKPREKYQKELEKMYTEIRVFFVPINDEIYNGLPELGTSTSGTTDSSLSKNALNDLISEEDSFHPNNLGYQIIANAFRAKMESTKNIWLK
jgi:lysophospholipase L1-like esterase